MNHVTTVAAPWTTLFPEPPTSGGVVQKSIDYLTNLTSKLGQDTTVITCDQAIYDIAKGLAKRYSEKYSNLVIRLGGFHIAENLLGAFGVFMKESGFEDMLVESKFVEKEQQIKFFQATDIIKCLTVIFLCLKLWFGWSGRHLKVG